MTLNIMQRKIDLHFYHKDIKCKREVDLNIMQGEVDLNTIQGELDS